LIYNPPLPLEDQTATLPNIKNFESYLWLLVKSLKIFIQQHSPPLPLILASIQDDIIPYALPYPISHIVFTTLVSFDPNQRAALITYVSIEVFSLTGERIFYHQRVTGRVFNEQGFNPFYGLDPGPPPPPNPPHQPSYN